MTVKLNCLQLLIKLMEELNGKNNSFCSHLAKSLSFLLSYDHLIGDNFMVTMSNILFSLDMY